MYEHNKFVFIFRSKLMTVKDEDDRDGISSWDSLFDQKECLNKHFLSLVPVKKVPYFGHYMMGLEL